MVLHTPDCVVKRHSRSWHAALAAVHVHCPHCKTKPPLQHGSHASMIQVTTDCRPQQLLEYLRGEAATAASTAAVNQERAKAEEDLLLEAARTALGVQHIIRLCSRNDQPTVTEPLQRLIQHGPAVRQAIDLSGMHICLVASAVWWSYCRLDTFLY